MKIYTSAEMAMTPNDLELLCRKHIDIAKVKLAAALERYAVMGLIDNCLRSIVIKKDYRRCDL